MKQEHALVVFSGGMDSATALWWAMREFETVSAVSFFYGAKHNARELAAADAICLDGHVVNKVGTFQIAIAAKHSLNT